MNRLKKIIHKYTHHTKHTETDSTYVYIIRLIMKENSERKKVREKNCVINLKKRNEQPMKE